MTATGFEPTTTLKRVPDMIITYIYKFISFILVKIAATVLAGKLCLKEWSQAFFHDGDPRNSTCGTRGSSTELWWGSEATLP